ncbi:YlxM family DNA-binding protein [Symbiobacterium thermophilum]|jgi:predicted DNA-binding protein YlxM (UPF0122 family)|uniref:UPF0122 protein STH1464 n=2 Tax=Symbiobacterium thermophilum TaxID=2734 RepID=Y1464_SYMTH|nr:YlxM family DNA-binding protein [Symbiobacterium thermophilum]Q67PE4.1 RecName: Full=UPF0122 protein STH1464 [Symbiobacterium thermophilum IAM 14863]MBY6275460.1 hypothetical protein [Symbiobacterium thermophilum]BAD40449.1 conserved hypothetical protein [Symbiobacterium thermophilum IAM 14863]
MKDVQRIALLFDFYGPLLTERQQELIRAYYLEDHSLAEIADADGVSRQAVHELIRRSEAALQEYEQRLGFVAEHQRRLRLLDELQEALDRADLSAARRALAALRAEA